MVDVDSHLRISPTSTGEDAVVVGGMNLSNVVCALLLTSRVGEPPRLVLELSPRAYVVDAEGSVVGVSPAGHAALVGLGWRPPSEDLAAVRRLAEALHRIDLVHLRHDTPHGQYHGYGEALLAALDGRKPVATVDSPVCVEALCRDVERDRDRLVYDRDRLVALVGEILREFTQRGHPGRPALRTGWVWEEKANGWRARLAELTAPPEPPAP